MAALSTPRDPYAVYAVERYDRATRRPLETLGTAMRQQGASNLAREYRERDVENEGRVGYRVATMPVHEQATVLAPAPYGTADRAPVPGASAPTAASALVDAVAEIDRLTAERDWHSDLAGRSERRDHNLRIALRRWAMDVLGTVDALCVEVANRRGCTVSVARASIYGPKSAPCLDTAVEIYREHAARVASRARGVPVAA